MTTDNTELKPCPCCGSKNIRFEFIHANRSIWKHD